MSGKWISVVLFALVLILARALIAAADEGRDLKQNNLAVCAGKSPVPAGDDSVTVSQFANWIAGTWLLRTRTIQGVQAKTDSKYYIALDEITDKMATGWALMIDKGNLTSMDYLRICPACLADASVGALWKVTITPDSGTHSIHLKMDGDYLGSYGDFRKGVQAVEQTHFHRYGDVFVAGQLKSPAGGQGLEDDTWDRVTLTGDTFTYMSCKNGFIDQFVKISNAKPTVGGVRLQDAWPAIKESGVLLNPPPLNGGK